MPQEETPSRLLEIADDTERLKKAVGAVREHQDSEDAFLNEYRVKTDRCELAIDKVDFRVGKLEEQVRVCGSFKHSTEVKLGGLQRLGAVAACLAMLDLVINFLQIGGIV